MPPRVTSAAVRPPPARSRRLLTLAEPGHELARGAAPVADRIFLLRRQLGHRPPVAVVDRHERGVVAEAAAAARLGGERTLAASLDHVGGRAGRGQRERTHVGDAAVAVLWHVAQELLEVLLVGRVLAGEASRAHTGPPAERGGLD